jgi:O-6-methylguanine DNA methyltransferase
MKPQYDSLQNILWHPSPAPLPDFGKQSSGIAHTPFGHMRIRWTDTHLLAAGFEIPEPGENGSSTAHKLADIIVSLSPLPIRPVAIGTAFQLRVWQALTQIPYGTTVSYQSIANAIGSPQATRAVGSAIGANRLALLIPCHRVIRSNGHIGGFGWGIPTKQKILTHEQT